MPIFDITHPITKQTISVEGAIPPDTATIDKLFALNSQNQQHNDIAEWGKSAGRAILATGDMLRGVGEETSNLIGRSFDVAPKNNPVTKYLRRVQDVSDRLKNKGVFQKSQSFAEENPVQNFFQEQVEGAIPYVLPAAIPGVGKALPFIAGASTHAKLTRKLEESGMNSDEAMLRAAPAALTETALFAAMHPIKNLVMGKRALTSPVVRNAEGVVQKTAAGETGTFIPGKAVDLLSKPLTKNPLVGDMTKPVSNLFQGIGREAAFTGPYLHAQGEAIMGVERLSGAMKPEEYSQAHGIDPNASTGQNLLNVGTQQLKSFGTSALVGAGFGVTGALNEKRIQNNQAILDALRPTVDPNKPTDLTGKADVPNEQPVTTTVPNIASQAVSDVTAKREQQAQEQQQQAQQAELQKKQEWYAYHTQRAAESLKSNEVSPDMVSFLDDVRQNATDEKLREKAATLYSKAASILEKKQKEAEQQAQDALDEQHGQGVDQLKAQDEIAKAKAQDDKTTIDAQSVERKIFELQEKKKQIEEEAKKQKNEISGEGSKAAKLKIDVQTKKKTDALDEQIQKLNADLEHKTVVSDNATQARLLTEEKHGIENPATQSVTLDSLGGQQAWEYLTAHPKVQQMAQWVKEKAVKFKDFAKQLVSEFGEKAKQYAAKLWNYIKNIQPGLSIEIISKEEADRRIAEQGKPALKGKMTFDYGSYKRHDIQSTSTADAIRNGERTSTTRYESQGSIDYWKKAKAGDIIEFDDGKGGTVLVRVTKPLYKLKGSGMDSEQWSKLEGWSTKYFNEKVRPKLDEAWQMQYEYIGPQKASTNPSGSKPIAEYAPGKENGSETKFDGRAKGIGTAIDVSDLKVPSFALPKEQAKANGASWVLAPKGVSGSFASRLAEKYDKTGQLITKDTVSNIKPGDVVYLSTPGKGRGYSFKSGEYSVIPEILERGGIIRTDTERNAMSSHNKDGEGAIYSHLLKSGYVPRETQYFAEWSKPESSAKIRPIESSKGGEENDNLRRGTPVREAGRSIGEGISSEARHGGVRAGQGRGGSSVRISDGVSGRTENRTRNEQVGEHDIGSDKQGSGRGIQDLLQGERNTASDKSAAEKDIESVLPKEYDQDRSGFHVSEFEEQKKQRRKQYNKDDELTGDYGQMKYIEEDYANALTERAASSDSNNYNAEDAYGSDWETSRKTSVKKQKDPDNEHLDEASGRRIMSPEEQSIFNQEKQFKNVINDAIDLIGINEPVLDKAAEELGKSKLLTKDFDELTKKTKTPLGSIILDDLYDISDIADIEAVIGHIKRKGNRRVEDTEDKPIQSLAQLTEYPQVLYDIRAYLAKRDSLNIDYDESFYDSSNIETKADLFLKQVKQDFSYEKDVLNYPARYDKSDVLKAKEKLKTVFKIQHILKDPQRFLDFVDGYFRKPNSLLANPQALTEFRKAMDAFYSEPRGYAKDASEVLFSDKVVKYLLNNIDAIREIKQETSLPYDPSTNHVALGRSKRAAYQHEDIEQGKENVKPTGEYQEQLREQTPSIVRHMKASEKEEQPNPFSRQEERQRIERDYEGFKAMASKDSLENDLIPVLLESLQKQAREMFNDRPYAIDLADKKGMSHIAVLIGKKLPQDHPFRKMKYDEQRAILRRLMGDLRLDLGDTFTYEFNKDDAYDKTISVGKAKQLIENKDLSPDDLFKVEPRRRENGSIVPFGDGTKSPKYVTIEEAELLLASDTKRTLSIATSQYPGVSENMESARGLNQLGQPLDPYKYDASSERPTSTSMGVKHEELFKVSYKPKGKLEPITAIVNASDLYGVKGRKDGLATIYKDSITVEPLGKKNAAYEYENVKTLREIATAAKPLMTKDDMLKIGAEFTKLDKAFGETGAGAKKEDIRKLQDLLLPYKAKLLQEQHAKTRLLEPDYFENIAKQDTIGKEENPYKQLGLSPAEHFQIFKEAGHDKAVYISQLNRRLEKHYQDRADYLYDRISKSINPVDVGQGNKEKIVLKTTVNDVLPRDIRAYVTSRLGKSDRADYERMMKGERVKTGESSEKSIVDTWPLDKRLRLTALRDVENRIRTLGYEVFQKQTSVATEKNDRGLKPNTEDMFRGTDEMSPFEQSLGVEAVGRLDNPISQKFYNGIAKVFGADLVVVSDPDYRSRYIGKASDGRSKLIINIKDMERTGRSFARVYAHELFHHVVRKSLPAEYAKFRESLEYIIGKEKWNAAVDDFIRKNYGTESRGTSSYESSRYNEDPRSTIYRGVTAPLEKTSFGTKRGYFRGNEYSSLSKIDPEWIRSEYQHGSKAKSDITPEQRAHAEEEIFGELFSHAVTQKGFYDHLSKTYEGRSLASKLISRLITKAQDVFNAVVRPRTSVDKSGNKITETGFRYEDQLLIKHSELSGVYELISDLIGNAYKSNYFGNDGANERYFTPLGEAKYLANKLKDKIEIDKRWNNVFPKGSKSWIGINAALKQFGTKIVEWIKENKPAGLFADFGADHRDVKLATEVLHPRKFEEAQYYAQIAKPFESAFEGVKKERLEQMHDFMVRNGKNVQDPKHIEEMRQFGMTDQQIEAFKKMQEVSDDLYKELDERGLAPDYLATHYGQSLMWNRKNREKGFFDPEFEWETNRSRFKGDDKWKLNKDLNRSTKEIADSGLEYKTINPLEMFMDYVRDVHKTLAWHDMVKQGMNEGRVRRFTNQANAASEGFVPVSDNATKELLKLNLDDGYKIKQVDGTYFKIEGQEALYNNEMDAYRALEKAGIEGAEVELVKPSERQKLASFYTVYEITRENGKTKKKAIRDFDTIEEAETFLDTKTPEGNMTFGVEERKVENANAISKNQLYFTKDLARMLNVIASPNTFRASKWGSRIMDVKNRMTSIELAFSLFHPQTIGQELVASTAGWTMQRESFNRSQGISGYSPSELAKKAKAYNPIQAYKDARELNALMDAILESPEIGQTPEFKAKAKELLGTDTSEMIDIVKQLFSHGGTVEGLDSDFQSEVHKYGKVKYSSGEDKFEIVDGKGVVTKGYKGISDTAKSIAKSIYDVGEKVLNEEHDPNLKITQQLKAGWKAGQFAAMEVTTEGLWRSIKRIKAAMFAREYSLAVDRNAEKLRNGIITRDEIARDTMKFVEDRFGEVNWNNMWMNKNYKAALQFAFRSFTWFSGSWKALAKGGYDIAKTGWFKVTDYKNHKEYELTSKGWWAINALIAHSLVAASITAIYNLWNGSDEVETPEDTPTLTKVLFPRVDPYDPSRRITIPSYVTEAYKIASHIGLVSGVSAEPTKLISGRFNSLVGGLFDIYRNQDFAGTLIRNPDDNYLSQAMSVAAHVVPLPISFSSMLKDTQSKGFNPYGIGLALLGNTDAPASAKRSAAANKAFELTREGFTRPSTDEQMAERNELKRAMYAYKQGNPEKLEELKRLGKVSKRQVDIQMQKVADEKIGKEIPMRRLTIDDAIKTWDIMSVREKELYRGELKKKYFNMLARQDKSPEKKAEIKDEMRKRGLI